jgi:xanthine/CO dehydrogenase XdhC/CoxF family maturation factor
MGTRLLLATVVHTSGSTYRKAGARMLMTQDSWIAGSISGGCLEGDLVSTAWAKTENGPTIATYDSTTEDDIVWGYGLGCNGVVEVLLERLPEDGGILAQLGEASENRQSLTVANSLCGSFKRWYSQIDGDSDYPEGLGEIIADLHGKSPRVVTLNGERFYVESHRPPRQIIVFGAGHDAAPLVRLAKSLGWRVIVMDHREGYASGDRFPEADEIRLCSPEQADLVDFAEGDAAIIMSHHYIQDRAFLRALLQSAVSYIGVLGPARRTNRMLEELGSKSTSRLHSPVGLDIGAEGPHEIALAIMAEIQAEFNPRRRKSE